MLLADYDGDPAVDAFILDCFESHASARALERLLAIATEFPKLFSPGAVAALVLLFEEPGIASRAMEVFAVLDPHTESVWALATPRALAHLDDDYREGSCAIIARALERKMCRPTTQLARRIFRHLTPLVDPLPWSPSLNRPAAAMALRALHTSAPRLVNLAAKEAVGDSNAHEQSVGATAVAELLPLEGSAQWHRVWATAVLDALSTADPRQFIYHEYQDSLVEALALLISASPTTVVPLILARLRTWNEYTSELPASSFRRAQLSGAPGTSWLPAVLAAIRDDGFPVSTRHFLANGTSVAVQHHGAGIEHLADALRTLVEVADQAEWLLKTAQDASREYDERVIDDSNGSILASTLPRLLTVAKVAARDDPNDAFERVTTMFVDCPGLLARSELLTLLGSIVGFDRRLPAKFVPFIAPQLSADPALQIGAFEGCAHLADISRNLVTEDLIRALVSSLATTTPPDAIYFAARILENVTVDDDATARGAFAYMFNVAMSWAVAESRSQQLQPILNTLFELATHNTALLPRLLMGLTTIAIDARATRRGAADALEVLGRLGSWYPEHARLFVVALLRATTVHGLTVGLDDGRPRGTGAFRWLFGYEGEALRQSAPAIVEWSESRPEYDRRLAFALLLAFGRYDEALSIPAVGGKRPDGLWGAAFRSLIEAELAFGRQDRIMGEKRLDDAFGATSRWQETVRGLYPRENRPDLDDEEYFELTHDEHARDEGFLTDWLAFRVEWVRTFKQTAGRGDQIAALQNRLLEFRPACLDDLDQGAFYVTRTVLAAAALMNDWFRLVLDGQPSDAALSAVKARFGLVKRAAGDLGMDRWPEQQAAWYRELCDRAALLDASEGPDELFAFLAGAPLLLLRPAFPRVVSPRPGPNPVHRNRVKLANSPAQDPLVRVRLLVGGEEVGQPIEVVAGELADLGVDLEFDRPIEGGKIVVEPISILDRAEYSVTLTVEPEPGANKRARFRGHMTFHRPQALKAIAHSITFTVSVQQPGQDRTETVALGNPTLVVCVVSTATPSSHPTEGFTTPNVAQPPAQTSCDCGWEHAPNFEWIVLDDARRHGLRGNRASLVKVLHDAGRPMGEDEALEAANDPTAKRIRTALHESPVLDHVVVRSAIRVWEFRRKKGIQ